LEHLNFRRRRVYIYRSGQLNVLAIFTPTNQVHFSCSHFFYLQKYTKTGLETAKTFGSLFLRNYFVKQFEDATNEQMAYDLLIGEYRKIHSELDLFHEQVIKFFL